MSPPRFPLFFLSGPSTSSRAPIGGRGQLGSFLPRFLRPDMRISTLCNLDFIYEDFLLCYFIMCLLCYRIHIIYYQCIFHFILQFKRFLFSMRSQRQFVSKITQGKSVTRFFVFHRLDSVASHNDSYRSTWQFGLPTYRRTIYRRMFHRYFICALFNCQRKIQLMFQALNLSITRLVLRMFIHARYRQFRFRLINAYKT